MPKKRKNVRSRNPSRSNDDIMQLGETEDIVVKVEITTPPPSPDGLDEPCDAFLDAVVCPDDAVAQSAPAPSSPECILGDTAAVQDTNVYRAVVKIEDQPCSSKTTPRPRLSPVLPRRSNVSNEVFERMVSLLSNSSRKGGSNLTGSKDTVNHIFKTTPLIIKNIFKPFKCYRCPKSFAVEHELRSHFSICDPNSLECDVCGEKMPDARALQEHSAANDCGTCKECGKVFSDGTVFKAHRLLAHAEGATFKCSLCKVSFNRVFSLTNHIRKVHSKKSLECEVCGQFLADEQSLNEHRNKNTCAKCHKCGKIFLNLSAFRAHMLSEHVAKGPSICHICKRAFRSVVVLKQHIRRSHPPKTYDCSTCGRVLPDPKSLRRHEAEQSCLKCYDCGKEFSTNSALKAHHLLTHPEDRLHKCTICNRNFEKATGLISHLRKIHKEQNPHKCKICGHRCATLPQHKAHLRTHKKKPYACTKCSMRFTSIYGRSAHQQRIHEKNKPYSCPQCNKSFAVKSFLNAHITYVHNPDKALKWQVRLESISSSESAPS